MEDCHQLLVWLIPLLDNFPRNSRFTLGERLDNGLLEVLTLCTHAAYQGKKQQLLDGANRVLTTLKHLWRWWFVEQFIV
ncbi:four helix bundle protein [Colwellia sp. KU-HH00111]|uniref:four helix bundle protein n=1 Tax=Colwellia sp. KU-HH00111 TaxID=3127652 RepID=UPI0033657424